MAPSGLLIGRWDDGNLGGVVAVQSAGRFACPLPSLARLILLPIPGRAGHLLASHHRLFPLLLPAAPVLPTGLRWFPHARLARWSTTMRRASGGTARSAEHGRSAKKMKYGSAAPVSFRPGWRPASGYCWLLGLAFREKGLIFGSHAPDLFHRLARWSGKIGVIGTRPEGMG